MLKKTFFILLCTMITFGISASYKKDKNTLSAKEIRSLHCDVRNFEKKKKLKELKAENRELENQISNSIINLKKIANLDDLQSDLNKVENDIRMFKLKKENRKLENQISNSIINLKKIANLDDLQSDLNKVENDIENFKKNKLFKNRGKAFTAMSEVMSEVKKIENIIKPEIKINYEN